MSRSKERNQKTRFCSFLSRTHPNSDRVNVDCCWLLLTERQSDCYVECVTVEHIECTDSVQCATETYWQ